MRVETKHELFARVAEQRQQLEPYGIKRLGVFGSFAREQHHDESDIDVLVEFEPGRKTFDNFMRLAFYLKSFSGVKLI